MEAPGGAPGVLARSVPVYVKIPTESEFLVYKSTPQGYVSYRNSEIGTRFIQTLCEVLDLEAKSSSPRDMLTSLTFPVEVNICHAAPQSNLESDNTFTAAQISIV